MYSVKCNADNIKQEDTESTASPEDNGCDFSLSASEFRKTCVSSSWHPKQWPMWDSYL